MPGSKSDKSREIILNAVQRYATEHTNENDWNQGLHFDFCSSVSFV